MSARIRWTDEKILAAIHRFYELHGRWPTAGDFVAGSQLLPAAKTLERRYGGLVTFRQKHNLPIQDFTKGDARSVVSMRIAEVSFYHERALQGILEARFGKHFVHNEKRIQQTRKRVDSYVFAYGYEFGVDVFFPRNYMTFAACLTIKLRTLQNINFDLYLVVANPAITDELIERFLRVRQSPIPDHVHIFSWEGMQQFLTTLHPLRVCDHDMSQNL